MRAGIGSSKNSATTVDLPLSQTAEAQALVLTDKSMGHTLHKLHFRVTDRRVRQRSHPAYEAHLALLAACASSRRDLCRGAVFRIEPIVTSRTAGGLIFADRSFVRHVTS